jgi:hypothetical protein
MKYMLLIGTALAATTAAAQTGSVKAYAKISSTSGNLTTPLANNGRFGYVSTLGPQQIASGAPFSGGGMLHLLTLNNQGTVAGETFVHAAQLPLFQNATNARFGTSTIALGDVNNDGTPDFLTGAPGLTPYGSIAVLLSTPGGYWADTIALPPFLKMPGAEWGSHLYRRGNEMLAAIETGSGKVVSFTINSSLQLILNQVYDNSSPILATMLDPGDRFGAGISTWDMDGDGTTDLLCGAPGDDDGGTDYGAVYVVLRNPDLSVKAVRKYATGSGGFTGMLNTADEFGISTVPLGDLDQDGFPDLAVGAPGDDDGGLDIGAVWILFLNDQGNIKLHRKINRLFGSFTGDINFHDRFGTRIASLGDLDGDGTTDLAVGTPEKDDGGNNRGAIFNILIDFCAPHTAIYNWQANGPQVAFTIPGGPGMSFLWNFDDGNYSQQQNPVHTYQSNGTFNVCLQVVGPCGGNLYCSPVQVTGASGLSADNAPHKQTLHIYPNPAQGEALLTGLEPGAQWRIMSPTGRPVAAQRADGKQALLPLHHLAAGVYMVEVLHEGQRQVTKLVVQ